MSGKPPLGSGNKRWNLGNSSNKINEKKEILKAIDDIYNIIERNSNLTTTTELSDILYKLSKLTIPNKQINLTKVILFDKFILIFSSRKLPHHVVL